MANLGDKMRDKEGKEGVVVRIRTKQPARGRGKVSYLLEFPDGSKEYISAPVSGQKDKLGG